MAIDRKTIRDKDNYKENEGLILKFRGKKYMFPGHQSDPLVNVLNVNGVPFFEFEHTEYRQNPRGETFTCQWYNIFTSTGKKVFAYDKYGEFIEVVNYGGIDFLACNKCIDWDYMIHRTYLMDNEGNVLLHGKSFYWDEDTKVLSFFPSSDSREVLKVGLPELKDICNHKLILCDGKIVRNSGGTCRHGRLI